MGLYEGSQKVLVSTFDHNDCFNGSTYCVYARICRRSIYLFDFLKMMIARSIFKACFLVIAYSIPLIGIEVFFQHNQRHLLIGDVLLYPLFSYVDESNSPIQSGLQRPNIKRENPHQFLFEYDDSTPVRYSTF